MTVEMLKRVFARAGLAVLYSPISGIRSARGRLSCVINLVASNLISNTLLINANNGPRGKAATKIVRNPNWSTAKIYSVIKCNILATCYKLVIGRQDTESVEFQESDI